ncbi:MAG: O-antigen ligase family protein [Candidatus Saccharibacteria bacterium]
MQLTKRLPYYASLLLLAYMPFHVFLVQSLSLVTGGLDVWKIAKDVVLAIVTLFVICIIWGTGRATKLFSGLVFLTIAYGALHVFLWIVHPSIYRPSAMIGLTYNLRIPCFAILGYGTGLLKPDIFKTRLIIKLVLVVSVVVTVLGIVQYFLPKDTLTHLGYSVARGVKPSFFIDDNPAFPRIMSTLRDPNSLGAYLVVPLALATLLALEATRRKQQVILASIVVAELIAEWLTYSRSALAAALVAMGLVVWWHYRELFIRLVRRWWPLLAVLVLIVGALGYIERNNQQITGLVTHTTNEQTGQYDSNQLHLIFVKRGLHGIAQNPLGHGPGTAGLASIQNPKGSFLTENYYVQIGYEVGVLGLLTFVAMNVLLWARLWRIRVSPLASSLLASGVAYIGMNMLLHTWSNEAVACQWWILAGLCLIVPARVKVAKNTMHTSKSA